MTVPLLRDSQVDCREWRLPDALPHIAKQICLAQSVHPAVSRVLAARGWLADERCQAFLNPELRSLQDPLLMHGMERGVARTLAAVAASESILVFGDYDADGVTSAAVMVEVLRFLGAAPKVFLPHRIDDGYGMHAPQMQPFANDGVRLIITVDTGITALEAIARAKELGMDVVITDHHLAGPELPCAEAIINPNVPPQSYPGGPLCGAGTAFKFAHALLKTSGQEPAKAKAFLMKLLDLVALGTIADCVPLWGENRVIARHGLEALLNSKRPGIQALRKVAKLDDLERLTCQNVGYGIAPRINATGRLSHPEKALELLTTRCASRATELAEELEALNRERRTEELRILEHALAQVEELRAEQLEHGFVLEGEDYHMGVVGIVAARVCEKHYRPCVVLRRENGTLRGSARSVPGLDVHAVITACADLLTRYGGHAQAAGLELPEENFAEFRTRFNQIARERFIAEAHKPTLNIDACLQPGEFTWELHKSIQKLEPFGQDNAEPVFMLEGVETVGSPRLVGQNHLKLQLRYNGVNFSAIGFNKGELLPLCEAGKLDVAGKLKENTWQGRVSLELELLDLRPSGST
ncbi:MAG: single-stranded-DNA-specific exonuclease RecJ [Sumerlaeia bacterium]